MDNRPKNHVHAMPERAALENHDLVVEGYAFDLRHDGIKADVASMEPLEIEPGREPTAVFAEPQVGDQFGLPSSLGLGQFPALFDSSTQGRDFVGITCVAFRSGEVYGISLLDQLREVADRGWIPVALAGASAIALVSASYWTQLDPRRIFGEPSK